MNLLIKKYLISDNQFRVFAIDKNSISDCKLENKIACLSALTTALLSEEERITFNFKNKNYESFLYIDSFSHGYSHYRLENDKISRTSTKLLVTKSKLKNFGASYNSIMQFDMFNISKNISVFYKESEQMETSFIENDNTILMIQPLPFFDDVQYDLLKEKLSNNQNHNHWLDEYLIDTNEISVLKL